MAKINKGPLIYFFAFLFLVFFGYSFGLNLAPVHLNQDELMFALNAKSIAKSGLDFYGNPSPFYFWHLNHFWATPVIVYLSSFILKMLPFSEATIRLSSVFVGVVSVGAVVLLTQKVLNNKFLTISSGILMATYPAFFINSRLLLDNIYIIPFVIFWLLFLYKYLVGKNSFYLFASGLALGTGIHSYHAAKIYMPLYFIFTILLLLKEKSSFKSFLFIVVGFLIPIIVVLPWLKIHPDTFLNQVSYVSNVDKSFTSFNIPRITASYFSYFKPSLLFTTGDSTLVHSTGRVGVFPFASVFFLAFGVIEVLRRKDVFSKVILMGFITFPIAPALVNDPGRISRSLVVIPFAVMLSVYGVNFLFNSKEKALKILAFVLIFLSIFEFGVFINDYFGNYRVRSSPVFNNNIGGAIESVQRSKSVRNINKVYLDKDIPYVDLYFKFYEIKNNLVFDKWEVYDFKSTDFSKLEKGSIVLLGISNFPKDKPDKVERFEKIETIRELDGTETFLIYFK